MKPSRTVACVTCYFDPDYVRSRTLRKALADIDGITPIIIKNTHRGALRYPEVVWRAIVCRFRQKPDMWLLNFRGYELLPLLLLLAGRKPVVYDEFINPVLVVQEHRSRKRGLVRRLMGLWSLLGGFYYWLVRRCWLVLTDTPEHAAYSAALAGYPADRFIGLPVGTDEAVFTPRTTVPDQAVFTVFTYTSGSQALHGLSTIIAAMELLKDEPHIRFVIAGRKGSVVRDVTEVRKRGAHVTHRPWIPFTELPEVIKSSDLCLGGPFGGTTQAELVVTGKTYQFLACGVPTVVGRAAYPGLFADKLNCLVVPQADAKALAAAIRWSYDHRDALPKIGQLGRSTYEQHFSQAIITGRLRQLLSEQSAA